MKRIIACALLLAMLLTLFAGCNTSANNEITPSQDAVVDTSALEATVEYLKTIYKDVEESTPVDYQRVATVRIGTDAFSVAWSVDVSEDLIKITESNGMVTVDVSDANPEDVPYVLTATVTDANGNSQSLSWNHYLPAAIVGDFSEILDMAYALESGESMDNSCTLTGVISAINTAWSDDYQNITVTIVMEGCEDKPIMCYRLKGEGAKDLAVGDQITVTGTIKNYNGTIEFDAGCTLDDVVKGVGEVVKAPENPAEILDAAYALAEGAALPYTATLTGKIVSVDTAWSNQYNNITVTIAIDGDNRTIKCFRLKGDGAKDLWKEDVITVSGTIKNYYGEVEFDAGCQLVDCIPGPRYHGKLPDQPDDPLQIIEDAYNLTNDSNLPYNVRISGYVTAVISPWSDVYHNITVNIAIPGAEDRPIQCFRMHGSENGANTIQVGDYITVFGSIKNYNGTIEFYAGAHCEKVVKGDGTLPWGSKDPEADTTLSVKEAYDLGNSKSHSEYTTGKYYVTGVIKDVYSDVYGNMHIQDAAGNELTIYGSYSADGSTRYDKMETKPVAGDTITVYGVIGKYGSTPQMKNAWIVKHVPAGSEDPNTLTIPEAVEKAKSMGANGYTEDKYYVTGKITKITSTTYGNLNIEDSNGNSLFVYGTYSADGTTRYDGMTTKPVVGDTITVYGVLGCYNSAPQMKNAWIVNHTPAGGTTDPEPEKPTEPADPEPGSTLTIKQANDLGKSKGDGEYTTGKYYVTGEIVEVWQTAYGNMNIKDAEGNTLTLYGTYSSDGSVSYGSMTVKPVAGDTITVYGVVGQYSGKPQMKNGWIVAHTPAGTTPEAPSTEVGPDSSIAEVFAAVDALSNNNFLSFNYTLTGTIVHKYDYDSRGFITVRIEVEGVSGTVQCWNMTGDGADKLEIGDKITVTGKLGKNSGGYYSFNKGCSLVSWVDNT